MVSGDRLTLEEVLAAFDEHLRRTRGACAGTRRNYARFVRAFLQTVSGDGPVRVALIHPREVAGFVGGLPGRYRPRTVELAASSLRSFFRFLRAEGLRADRLEDAVPMIPHRPGRSGPASGRRPLRAADRLLGFVLAARAAGQGDHLVPGPTGATGQRNRRAAAGGSRLAQRHRAGACPQDRSRRAAAAARRGGGGPGGLPAARPPPHAGPPGVRAAPAARWRSDQQ
jgi:hypothetical protein